MNKMMTKITLVFIFILSLNYSNAQAVSQGKFIIDPYYGFPNLGKSIVSNGASNSDSKETFNIIGKGKGIGPAGLRMEYMLGDRVGIGADVIYNSFSFDWQYDSLNTNGTLYRSYLGNAKMSRLRIQARFNFHFEVSNPNLDAYFGVGAGTNTRTWTVSSDDPTLNTNKVTARGTLLPFSMRVCSGIRYYFTENIGFNMELGIGGPILSAGLSLKF
jgi:hypothetical protein